MKLYECIKIAITNVRVAKALSVKIIVGLSVTFMLLFCITIYRLNFNAQIRSFSAKHSSGCYMETEEIIVSSYDEYTQIRLEYKNLAKRLNASDILEIVLTTSNTKEENKLGSDVIKNATLVVEQMEYSGLSEWECNNSGEEFETSKLFISMYDGECTVFPEAAVIQYKTENDNQEYLHGRMPEKSGEMILSNYILECFGIPPEQQKTLIGKKLSLYKQTGEAYFENYQLTGIFDAHMLTVREQNSYNPVFEHVILHCNNADIKTILPGRKAIFRFYGENYKELERMYHDCDSENITLSPFGEIYILMDKQIVTVNKVLRIIVIHFVIATIIYIMSIFQFYLERNKRFLLMLRAIGMDRYQLYIIPMIEVLVMSTISMVCGLYGSFFILLGLNRVYTNITGFSILYDMKTSICVIFTIFLVVNTIFLTVSYYNARKIFKMK